MQAQTASSQGQDIQRLAETASSQGRDIASLAITAQGQQHSIEQQEEAIERLLVNSGDNSKALSN